MYGVPVMANAAAAVPETLDGAGILIHGRSFEAVAEMMGRVAAPGPFREGVLAGQQARLARFRQRDVDAELRRHLAPLLG